MLSGLLGVGGGVIFVPLLTYLTKIDFKTNTGISSLAVVFVASASSLTYIFNDFNKGSNLILATLVIIFLFVNLQNNTENSSNQSTNLDEVSNQEMEKVIELNPDIMPMRIALANRYFEAYDYSSALPHFMYVAENSNDIDLKSLSLSQIGWMVYESGDINTSLNYINEALRISPKSLLAETYKGIILIQQTDTRDEGILILNSLRNNPSLSEEDLSIIEEILEIYES